MNKQMLESFDKLFHKKILKEESNSEKLKKVFSDLNLENSSSASEAKPNLIANKGDAINLLYGWMDDNGKRVPIKGPEDIIEDINIDNGEVTYFLKNTKMWIPGEMILKKQNATSAIDVNNIKVNPLPPDMVKKAQSRNQQPNLSTVQIKGVEIPVIEHFKDIKEYCDNAELFRRWYNRQQFLNYILGTFESNGKKYDPTYEGSDEGDFGQLLGQLDGENSSYSWFIEIYDTSAMTKEALEDAVNETGSYDRGFFLKAKNGKIYFVFTDVD